MKKTLLLIVSLLISDYAFSQCMLYPVSLTERINNATVIVEGKVTAKESFWNEAHNLIHTANTVEVYKILSGAKAVSNQIIVITQGGQVGEDYHEVTPSLQLQIGDGGVFMLELAPAAIKLARVATNNQFRVYADQQGFIRFLDVNRTTATDIFNTYTNIANQVYKPITQQKNSSIKLVKSYPAPSQQKTSADPVINSLSPLTINAGNDEILTITGSSFGASQGTSTVKFATADNGGSTYTAAPTASTVSWADGQIRIKVPSGAGTGMVQVVVNGVTVTSTSTITVPFALLNISNKVTQHYDDDGQGGYTFQFFTEYFQNTPAVEAFKRAVQTLRCGTFINWKASTVTSTVDAAVDDGINIVRFDNGAELLPGVLGTCQSYYDCFGSTRVQVKEMDVNFDDGQNWHFGPSNPAFQQYDFESVMLHELGHGHQWGHVNSTSDVMSFNIANGVTKRSLTTNNINAGNTVMGRSTVAPQICSKPLMIKLNTANCVVNAPEANFSGTPTTSCANSATVAFTDLSSGLPTTWKWDFDNNGTTDATTQNPTYTYSMAGDYSVRLIVTNNAGLDTVIKTNYISIGNVQAPYTQNFETALFPPNKWSLTASPQDAVTWTTDTVIGINGTSTICAKMPFSEYGIAPLNQVDNLVSEAVSLAGLTSPVLVFNSAYRYFPDQNNYDTLKIVVSDDCGVTFSTPIFNKSGVALSRNKSHFTSTPYEPTVATEWVKDTISLGAYKDKTVKLKLIAINRFGKNLYIDDIKLMNLLGPPASAKISITAGNDTICQGSSVTFKVKPTNGGSTPSYQWKINGTAVQGATDSVFTSTTLANADKVNCKMTSSLSFVSNSVTESDTITMKVNPADNPSFSYSGTTFCVSGSTNPVPTIMGTAGGVFSSTPNGLTLNSISGKITLASSQLNTYTVSYTTNGICPKTATQQIVITDGNKADFKYTKATYRKCDANPAPVFIRNGKSGSFSAQPSGLSITATTGVVNIANSQPRTYTVTNSVAAQGGCIAVAFDTTITIGAIVSAPTAVSPVKYCKDAVATPLTATGEKLRWYTTATGGTGNTTAPTPNTTVVGTTSYYVSQTIDSCESARERVDVQISTTSLPGTTARSLCKDAAATALTANGTNLKWYTEATGGTGSTTAPIPNTSTIGTINYYVSQTVNGCESGRQKLAVTIIAAPIAAFTASPALTDTLIKGSTVAFTFSGTMGSSPNYKWNFGDGSSLVFTKNASHKFDKVGAFMISLTVTETGCADTLTQGPLVVKDKTTSTVYTRAKDQIKLYPNPTTGVFTLITEQLNTPTTITVMDAMGKLIFETVQSNTAETIVDLTTVADGLYYVKAVSGNKVQIGKLQKIANY